MLGYTENFIYTKTPLQREVRVGDCYEITLTDRRSFSVETMVVSGEFAGNS